MRWTRTLNRRRYDALPCPPEAVVAAVPTCDGRITLALTADGQGLVAEPSGSTAEDALRTAAHWVRETFEHGLAPDALAGLDALEGEARREAFADFFYGQINPDLDDPYFRSNDDLASDPLSWNGDAEAFERMVRVIAHSDPRAEEGPIQVSVVAAAGDEPAKPGWSEDEDPRWSAYLRALLEQHRPSGGCWAYNDGAYDRRSGYNHEGIDVTFVIDPPSATERLEARVKLEAWRATLPEAVQRQLAAADDEIGA